MINEAYISLNGFVATQPFFRETRTGIPMLNMRVAWTPRRLDRATGDWVDADTSFASVVCYRKLAENAATCVRKGDAVVVHGRVSVREYEDRNGLQRTSLDVEATSMGPDLSRGVAQFQRLRPQTGLTAMEFQAAEGGEAGSADDAALARLMAGDGSGSAGGDRSLAARDGGDGPGALRPGRSGDEEAGSAAAGEPGPAADDVLADEAVSVAVPF